MFGQVHASSIHFDSVEIFLMGELWKTTKDPYKIATFGILPYLTSIKLEPVVS